MRGRLPPVRWHVMHVCLTCFFFFFFFCSGVLVRLGFYKRLVVPVVCLFYLGITIKLFNLRNSV